MKTITALSMTLALAAMSFAQTAPASTTPSTGTTPASNSVKKPAKKAKAAKKTKASTTPAPAAVK